MLKYFIIGLGIGAGLDMLMNYGRKYPQKKSSFSGQSHAYPCANGALAIRKAYDMVKFVPYVNSVSYRQGAVYVDVWKKGTKDKIKKMLPKHIDGVPIKVEDNYPSDMTEAQVSRMLMLRKGLDSVDGILAVNTTSGGVLLTSILVKDDQAKKKVQARYPNNISKGEYFQIYTPNFIPCYVDTAKKYEKPFRAILDYYKKKHKGMSVEQIYQKYSGGDRYGIWTILGFSSLGNNTFMFSEEDIATLSGGGSQSVFKWENGKIRKVKDLQAWVS